MFLCCSAAVLVRTGLIALQTRGFRAGTFARVSLISHNIHRVE